MVSWGVGRWGAGVGKTALVDELRPVVTGSDGWFVAGKFDQYRRDLEFDAVHQVFRGLGRLLLAEPEDELAEVRGRIWRRSAERGVADRGGAGVRGVAGGAARSGDPLTAQVRSQRMTAEVLRAAASRKRPLVVFVDDLQWAGARRWACRSGVGARSGSTGCCWWARIAKARWTRRIRWRRCCPDGGAAGVRHLRLVNLPVSGHGRHGCGDAARGSGRGGGLVEVINPYCPAIRTRPWSCSTRCDATVLTATAAGWRWDAASVRAHWAGPTWPGCWRRC